VDIFMQIMLRRTFFVIFILILIHPSIITATEKTATTFAAEKNSVTVVKEIDRDGRFIAYNNGTVIDTRTNLMWAANDNGADINCSDAMSYCKNYHGGGYIDWRMPTQDELEGLYDKSIFGNNDYHLTKMITLTASCLWTSETRRYAAYYFHFRSGTRHLTHPSNNINGRVLPVRSVK
jgi:hypothetical protein